MRTLAVSLIVVLLSAAALADTLYLEDGTTYEGKLLSDSGGKVRFRTTGGIVLTLSSSEVDRIEKGRTISDEYKDRRKALSDDDLKGLLDLAAWCEEKKLFSQRKKLFREIRGLCPNHPEARREQGQIFDDGKWVKAPKDLEDPRIEKGERQEVPETAASLVLPKGWAAKLGKGTATATGPDRYATPPVLTVEFGEDGSDPAASFPEKEGWAKPEAAEAPGHSGLRSRRSVVNDHIESVERLAVLSSGSRSIRVRLTCLAMEDKLFAPALDQTLESLKFKAPPADYVNTHYHYSCNLPKGDDWHHAEDEEFDLALVHKGEDPTDYAQLHVITGDSGEEEEAVRAIFEAQRQLMKATGDVKEEKTKLGGEDADCIDGTFLSDGVPVRGRMLLAKHKTRVFFLMFLQHEFGQKKSNVAWDTVVKSFRFTE